MTLVSARRRLVDLTGRVDLVVDDTDYVDAGANQLLRDGQKWLDRTFVIEGSYAIRTISIGDGAWFVGVGNCAVISEVWLINSLGVKYRLKTPDRPSFVAQYLKDPALISSSAPRYYTILPSRAYPIGATTPIGTYWDAAYVISSNSFESRIVILYPPLLGDATLEVYGRFGQDYLTSDTSYNLWTESFENILVFSACRQMEIGMRNQQGVSDWEAAIAGEIQGLVFDAVEQEVATITGIRG